MATESDRDNLPLEEELYDFLQRKADFYGFVEPKRTTWIRYNANRARGEEVLSEALSALGLDPATPRRVLDVGCGYGGLLRAILRNYGAGYAVDVLPERVVWSSRRCPEADVACASAAALPWASGYFDVVLSIGVFGYLSYKQQEEAAAEIFRVLAPGGVAFLNVPNRFSFFDPHNYVYFATWLPRALQGPYVRALSANGDHIESWLHSGPGWRSVFERAGFQVKTLPVKFSNSWRTADEFQLLLTKPGAEAR